MKKYILLAVLFISSLGFAQNWSTNIEEAKAKATAENKTIVLVFSGSDWCAPCIKLDKNVWQSEEFKAYATEKYNQECYFPLVVVLNADGKVIARKGYENQNAAKFVAELQALIK